MRLEDIVEKWQTRDKAFVGRVFSVETGTVALEDGRRARRDIVVHNGGVAIAAQYNGRVILVKQFRVAIKQEILELPAGTVEGTENPRDRAAIELQEETGYRAAHLDLVADYYVSPGYTTERMRIFVADGLDDVGQSLDGDEQIEVVLLPLAEAQMLLARGEFRDSKTIIGLQALFLRLTS